MRIAVLAVSILLSVSCVPTPDYYTAPAQHTALNTPPEPASGEYVRAAQPDAETYFLRDIMSLEGAGWRWTRSEPELRLRLGKAQKRTFRLDLTVAEATFKDTGPLQLVVRVNGKELDRPVFGRPGPQRYELPLPDGLLRAHSENTVHISVLNPWLARDGVKLGFLLHGAGFGEL